jgi:hypothetical protein
VFAAEPLGVSSGSGTEMDAALGDERKKREVTAEVEAASEFSKLASDRGLSLTGPEHGPARVVSFRTRPSTSGRCDSTRRRRARGLMGMPLTRWRQLLL